jgi:Protein of unknown function (DUF2637)
MTSLRRVTDGVLFQAVLTGSLSFSHIHDLAAAHGQSGWKAWLYPLSVDLLTVAAYRKLMAARRADGPVFLAWCAFLLGLEASLAANIISAWNNPDRLIAVALGVWPAVAFLVCTLLSHDPAPAAQVPAPAAVTVEVPAALPAPVPVPPPAEPAPAVVPAVAVPAPDRDPAPAPVPAVMPAPPGVSPKFLEWARGIAEQHRTEHGTEIDPGTLRTRLKVKEPLAASIHAYLTQPAGA